MQKLSQCFFAILVAYSIAITLFAVVITHGYFWNILYFAQAHTLIRIFEDMENRAIDDPQKAKDYADYVQNHYPAGTFFVGHSLFVPGNLQCEWIVEKSRRETLDRMRAKHQIE